MQKEQDLDKRIKRSFDLATDAFKDLKEIQEGKKPILKTGQDFIDSQIGGLLPSDAIMIAGGSGIGKTKLLYDTLELMMSTDININADNFVSLDFSLETKFLNKIIRAASKRLKKPKSKIIVENFSEEERQTMASYYRSLEDNRRFTVEETVTVKDFYDITTGFCEKHKDKDCTLISVDHVLLLAPSEKGEDKHEVLTRYINILKKKYKNVYFILLNQYNRTSLQNIKDRSNDLVPRSNVIYGSSHYEFLCSYIIGILNPFQIGVKEFMSVNKERYDWLEDFMTEENSKGKVAFNTMGNMFYFVLKARESDNMYKNLFIREMDLTKEEKEKMSQSVEQKESQIETPRFEEEENNNHPFNQ